MLNVFEFVIVLVIAVLAFRLWETKIKHKNTGEQEAEQPDVQAQLQALEGRIKVLERIVTDSQYDLKRQFKDLEDDQGATP